MASFSLSDRKLILSSADDIRSHIPSDNLAAITTFSVDGNSIGTEAGETLRELLDAMPILKSANFSNIFSQRQKEEIPDTLAAICQGLKSKSTLLELDLSDNAIGVLAIESIVPLLVENRSLRVLKINNVGLGPTAATIAAKALHLGALLNTMHHRPSSLRVLICGRSRLEDGSALAWSEAFAEHPDLAAVHIPTNDICEVGLTAIAQGLQRCPALRYINVSDNDVGRKKEGDVPSEDPDVDASTVFARGLAVWPKLEYLNLADCRVTAAGTTQIIRALALGNNPQLQSLVLDNACFEASFGDTLLQALRDGALPRLAVLKIAEQEGLEDADAGVWPEIDGILVERQGGVVFERDIEEEEDTTYLDHLVATLVTPPESVSLVDTMAALSV
ncbi:hypothetical protein C8R46DRAFT_1087768 [Mycena filopes]|nr:hypothetical protein C8R46DRAFT_1087768 [Mycena filopes]